MSDTTTVSLTRNHNVRAHDQFELVLPADSPHLATILAGPDASAADKRALDAYLASLTPEHSGPADEADDPAATIWVDAINDDAAAAESIDVIDVEN